MNTVNLFDASVPDAPEDRPSGFRRAHLQIGPLLNASQLGATLYEVPSGEQIGPYHYEYNNEEWLVVVSGNPTLRTPKGEQALRPGDVVAFLEGPEGAHSVSNVSGATSRVLTSRRSETRQSPSIRTATSWRSGGSQAARPTRSS